MSVFLLLLVLFIFAAGVIVGVILPDVWREIDRQKN